MSHYDFSAPRLYLETDTGSGFEPDRAITLDKSQHNYLCNVLRLSEGAPILVFNGRDGEWRAVLVAVTRKVMALRLEARVREQTAPGDLHYLFAPLKHARLDYIVQKAVEMGASAIHPVVTRRTQNTRINIERMRANAIEAAEQCGIITLPTLAEPTPLTALLAAWDPGRTLIFCDEDAPLGDALAALHGVAGRPLAVLIGPEGGFDDAERAALLGLPSIVRLSLGPRILRADTAGVAAMALVQATIGDWIAHR
ncbi:16S rRNA (uracil(1498)-N(3))-methyltransferase [Beijerinckia sp. L45]|uniref:16S rRNA (uracil(1498)-N(3))-methyltransferase n=1 Tax=Beijerinckia sp. L45 TaxID=1641855 RepID=UPI00131E819D|nr:16S rRNA (uracil(1498)-N(3))-methyltransferase [Beijerinckia sp. L45]